LVGEAVAGFAEMSGVELLMIDAAIDDRSSPTNPGGSAVAAGCGRVSTSNNRENGSYSHRTEERNEKKIGRADRSAVVGRNPRGDAGPQRGSLR